MKGRKFVFKGKLLLKPSLLVSIRKDYWMPLIYVYIYISNYFIELRSNKKIINNLHFVTMN